MSDFEVRAFGINPTGKPPEKLESIFPPVYKAFFEKRKDEPRRRVMYIYDLGDPTSIGLTYSFGFIMQLLGMEGKVDYEIYYYDETNRKFTRYSIWVKLPMGKNLYMTF